MLFCGAYKPQDHWRFVHDNRKYEIICYQYNDFPIEQNSYDYHFIAKGFKWQIARKFLNEFDYSQYEYIGFMDDDLVTDYQSINRAIEIATQNDIKLFQLSTIAGSESTHRILHQKKELKYSLTNFIEGMGPFFHISVMPKLVELFSYHDFKSGWGLDTIYSPILKEKAGVIHEVSMYHPPKPSYYDKGEAFKEMDHVLGNVYPKFMKDTYNETVEFYNEKQVEYEITMRIQ
jgi:hypothetical protein